MHRAGVSDYIMVFALLFTWITTVVNYYQTRFGKGAILNKVQKVISYLPEKSHSTALTLLTRTRIHHGSKQPFLEL